MATSASSESNPLNSSAAGLTEVLDSFRRALANSAEKAIGEARQSLGAHTGSRPAFGVDALDIDLVVGVEIDTSWGEDAVRLAFSPPPDAASRIRFRVSALPVDAVLAAYIVVDHVYERAGTYARHEFLAAVRDEKSKPVPGANVRIRVRRDDTERGQVLDREVVADRAGEVRFVVHADDRTIAIGNSDAESLPAARQAKSWLIRVQCTDPLAESDAIHVERKPRTRG